jgi:hypothetical protein
MPARQIQLWLQKRQGRSGTHLMLCLGAVRRQHTRGALIATKQVLHALVLDSGR